MMIHKDPESRIWLFDSHSRNGDGMPAPDEVGKSILINLKDMAYLNLYIAQLAGALSDHVVTFEVVGFTATQLLQACDSDISNRGAEEIITEAAVTEELQEKLFFSSRQIHIIVSDGTGTLFLEADSIKPHEYTFSGLNLGSGFRIHAENRQNKIIAATSPSTSHLVDSTRCDCTSAISGQNRSPLEYQGASGGARTHDRRVPVNLRQEVGYSRGKSSADKSVAQKGNVIIVLSQRGQRKFNTTLYDTRDRTKKAAMALSGWFRIEKATVGGSGTQ
ncbi:hypothetical protein PoB_007328900 [Plakobranchus ocellatus]|uniref:Uncharacterized protein n=1 Tax=Plakobranchus ocellatus TaxID=259542 RepID=A0AAV4DS00_9GAST|nr:hypothetical protein PoB_007328900 [Plakobranchus ocellatus]